jgi:hypothetical protein
LLSFLYNNSSSEQLLNSTKSINGLVDAFSHLSLKNNLPFVKGHIDFLPYDCSEKDIKSTFAASPLCTEFFEIARSLQREHHLSDISNPALMDILKKRIMRGSCFGQALSFILFRRPEKESTRPFSLEEKCHAIFLQFLMEMTGFIQESLEKSLVQFRDKLHMCSSKQEKVSRLLQINKNTLSSIDIKKHKKKKQIITRVRLAKLAQKQLFTQNSLGKVIGKLQKKRASLIKKKIQLHLLASRLEGIITWKFLARGINTGPCQFFSRKRKKQRFFEKISERLHQEHKKGTSTDLALRVKSFGDPISHMLVFQPHALRIYDSNSGQLSYSSFEDALSDIIHYCRVENVESISIESYSNASRS